MTPRALQAIQRAIAAKDWVRPLNDSEGAVFEGLLRRGYLKRRRIDSHHEYYANLAVVEAARRVGIIPENQ